MFHFLACNNFVVSFYGQKSAYQFLININKIPFFLSFILSNSQMLDNGKDECTLVCLAHFDSASNYCMCNGYTVDFSVLLFDN